MYPWYRDSVAAAAAAGLGGPVGVVGSGFCSTGPGQGATTIKTESGYSDCMLALDYVQSKVSDTMLSPSYSVFYIHSLFHFSPILISAFHDSFSVQDFSRYLSEIFNRLSLHFHIVRLNAGVVWLPISFAEYKDRVQCQHEMKILLLARLMMNIRWEHETWFLFKVNI